MKPRESFRILFMGTPAFAVPSLRLLVENKFCIAGIVTAPDKPAGRGRQLGVSAVKAYAAQASLPIWQPANLRAPSFIDELRRIKPDLGVVVAFRMLPEDVWSLPEYGTINLHASLLPAYRGAAPINRAIMNGEKQTGVTTFFLRQEIDTGPILYREAVSIGEDEDAGTLHDRLMTLGADVLLKTVEAIRTGTAQSLDQSSLEGISTPMAAKIFRKDCQIPWSKGLDHAYNHIRGLSPHPGAWTLLRYPGGDLVQWKIFKADKHPLAMPPGQIAMSTNALLIGTGDGSLDIRSMQPESKNRMEILEFLRGSSALHTCTIEVQK